MTYLHMLAFPVGQVRLRIPLSLSLSRNVELKDFCQLIRIIKNVIWYKITIWSYMLTSLNMKSTLSAYSYINTCLINYQGPSYIKADPWTRGSVIRRFQNIHLNINLKLGLPPLLKRQISKGLWPSFNASFKLSDMINLTFNNLIILCVCPCHL